MANKVLRKLLSPLYAPVRHRLHGISAQLDRNAVLLGQLRSREVSHGGMLECLSQAEFKVFSQFGEDGIIQYLLSRVPIERRSFVEFGVEDYEESNTRFLLINNKWSGLVIESNEESVERIKRSDIYWKCDLRAVAAFVTRENINRTISEAGFEGDLGLLSIDIDGNDYWVWQAVEAVQPRIVICEFNRRFGCDYAVTIPYRADFNAAGAHPSRLYYGASLPALCLLAAQKGYDFVGCTSEGVNAFFVRQDLSSGLVKLDAQAAFKLISTASHNGGDALDEMKAIEHLEVYDLEAGRLRRLSDLRHPRPAQ
jgi:hypothetical protein